MIAMEGRSLSSPLKKPDSPPPPPPPPAPPPCPLILLLTRSFLEVDSDLLLRMDDRKLSLKLENTSAAVLPPAYISTLLASAAEGFSSPAFLFDDMFKELSASVEELRLKSGKSPARINIQHSEREGMSMSRT
jgi:hypothetical protein